MAPRRLVRLRRRTAPAPVSERRAGAEGGECAAPWARAARSDPFPCDRATNRRAVRVASLNIQPMVVRERAAGLAQQLVFFTRPGPREVDVSGGCVRE